MKAKYNKAISTALMTTAFLCLMILYPAIAKNKATEKKAVADTSGDAAVNPLSPDYNKKPMQDWEKKFAAFQFRVYKKNGHTLPYRIYIPANLEPGKKYPLVLFYHGAGERGLDNRLQFFRFTTFPFWEKYPCYVLAPQCPPKTPGGPDGEDTWVQTSFGAPSHTMKAKPSWPMELSMELLDTIINQNAIDKSRIYVTGLSMGGFATWEILQREGKRFAAAMPVSGGADLAFAKKMRKIPIWVFHGGADNVVLTERSRAIVKAIREAGGKPIYTEFPGVGHGAWTHAYPDPLIWDWLFAQHK